MSALVELFKLFLHLDVYLTDIIHKYGTFSYAIIFFIIFIETGLVFFPFLPGDSLLFASGALTASLGVFNIYVLWFLLIIAAFLGDSLNYAIGRRIGMAAFNSDSKYIKKEYLYKAQHFYEKHGNKAIVLARFAPVLRSFAPFVAGIGEMTYGRFISYNLIGGTAWVTIMLFLGYFFGNIDFVKNNFETVIFTIIFISFIPVFFELFADKFKKKKEIQTTEE